MAKEKDTKRGKAEVASQPKPASGTIRVVATRLGFYGHLRRRPGDVFTLRPYKGHRRNGNKLDPVEVSADQQFSDRWMEKVDKSTPEKVTTSQEALNATSDSIKRDKHMAKAADDSAAEAESTGDASVI